MVAAGEEAEATMVVGADVERMAEAGGLAEEGEPTRGVKIKKRRAKEDCPRLN